MAITITLNNNNAEVVVLSRSNFKRWKEYLEFALGMVDINQVLHKNKPPPLNNSSTTAERDNYTMRERSNRLCILSFGGSIAEHVKRGLPIPLMLRNFLPKWNTLYPIRPRPEI